MTEKVALVWPEIWLFITTCVGMSILSTDQPATTCSVESPRSIPIERMALSVFAIVFEPRRAPVRASKNRRIAPSPPVAMTRLPRQNSAAWTKPGWRSSRRAGDDRMLATANRPASAIISRSPSRLNATA